jgi:argininosuccinate lyase
MGSVAQDLVRQAGGPVSRDEPLWAGRFTKPPAPETYELTRSLGSDRRLARQDVEVSVAHVQGLEEAGLLTPGDAASLIEALRDVGNEIEAGAYRFASTDEDVHMAVERGVTERLGELGARLHAGRSRNDLVVTDFRLWLLGAAADIRADLGDLISALVERARETADMVVPGFTHNRPAQVVTMGFDLMGHAFALERDRDRLRDWAARTSVSPLGAGALATSTLPLDPKATAARLGFDRSFENSLDAISDRDFVLELLSAAGICGIHVSRLAADFARWSEPGPGWVEIDEAFSTGSSMMPQKRNPDVLELARGKAGRLIGDFVSLATLLAGLPLGYHRDLQEDKEPAFDAVDTLRAALPAVTGVVRTARFDPESMREAALTEDLYATDLAEALVANGVAFRDAHRRTGELLKGLAGSGRGLRDLTTEEWKRFGLPEGATMLDPERSVAARSISGGPAPDSVRAQADALEARLRS